MNRRTRALLAGLLLVAPLVGGCSDFISPSEDDALVDRTIRQNVLDAIEQGYLTKDIDVLEECFGDALVFYLEPETVVADSTLPDAWGVETELMLHDDAFGSRTEAASVSLTLAEERDPLEIEGPTPGDPSMWEYYQRYEIRATVDGVIYQLNGYATFTLACEEGDTTEQGAPLWSIVEWSDTGDVPCRSDVITNWTGLKLLFAEHSGPYPLRTTPPNVIEKLVGSYESMNALSFVDCFAESFRFWPNPSDVNDPGNSIPEWWGLGTESSIAWNMFGPDSNIESVQLTLTQIGTPTQVPAPGGGDPGWEYTYSVDLWVHLPNQLTFWANAPSRFQVFPDADDLGPSGEELWEITKWEDIDFPGTRAESSTWGGIKAYYRDRPGGRVEESSWGSIKAMYR